MQASTKNAADDLAFVIERVIDAPARFVFEAHSKPEHVLQWFGPKPYPLTMCQMDFRVGGRYRFQMTGPGGVPGPIFGGEYLEIVPNQKIAYSNCFEAPGSEMMIVTTTFVEKAGKTTMTVHTLFGSLAMKNQHLGMGYEKGLGVGIEQLKAVVAALVKS